MSEFLPILIPVCIAIVVIVFICICIGVMYRKAPPNTAMVVTGLGGCKTVNGKGCFVIPFLQRVDIMSLENIQSDFTSKDEIPTKDAINVFVDAVANVSISTKPELLKIASSKFLGYSTRQIQEIITPILEGNIREIISQTTLKELIQGDKKEFAQRVIENVTPNLNDMGLELTTFNIQNFKDKQGVIENLGIDNIVQIQKDAAISKANAQKEIAIAQANSERDTAIAQAQARQESNTIKVTADTEIAKKNNELSIQKAELKREADIKAAEADAAYKIQEEEQRKTIEITTANANLARQEKEIELKAREVEITEKALEAEVKKKADAEKYAKQQSADAALYKTQRESEAELFERQKKAEAEKFEATQKADAEKARSEAAKVAMENEAIGIKAKGEAEAAAIQAKAIAEAEGIRKKAEALKEYGEAARQQMQLDTLKVYFEQLPAIAEATAKGYTNVDKIYMYGGDSTKLTENMMSNITQISEGLSQSLGVDLKSLLVGALGSKIINHLDNED